MYTFKTWLRRKCIVIYAYIKKKKNLESISESPT